MKTKLLFIISFVMSLQFAQSQQLLNLVFAPTISPTTATVDLTFDFTGVSAGDKFEWQLTLANSDGSPTFSRNIAYQGNITPNAVGSGTQTITIGTYNNPVDGEVFTWAGKITLGSNGTDTGYNNTNNLVTVSNTAGVDEFSKRVFRLFPNPAIDVLNIYSELGNLGAIDIYDVSGRLVVNVENVQNSIPLNISNLNSGLYVAIINKTQVLKFIKQ